MLVTSIFSFSHNVFYPLPEQIPIFQPHLFIRLQMLLIWTSLKFCGFGKELRINLLLDNFIFSSTGRRPASLWHGLLSIVRPSVCALTFSLNIFFAETTYRILMKFHRNVPTMVLFRIS